MISVDRWTVVVNVESKYAFKMKQFFFFNVHSGNFFLSNERRVCCMMYV